MAPRVKKLVYRLRTGEELAFENAQRVSADYGDVVLDLHHDVLTAEMRGVCESVHEARRRVESLLEAWSVHTALNTGDRIRFAFETAEMEQEPKTPGSVSIYVEGGVDVTAMTGIVHLKTTRSRYPEPPVGFAVSADVRSLWNRLDSYLRGHEPLPSMAYFCFTLVRDMGGGMHKAPDYFRVSHKVLKRLGRLTSAVGNHEIGRKAGLDRSHTAVELEWIEAVVKALILRAGEVAAGKSNLPLIDIAQFPRL